MPAVMAEGEASMLRLMDGSDEDDTTQGLAWRVGLWVAVVAVLAFLPAIGCDFINMDDNRNFLYNKAHKYPSSRSWSGPGPHAGWAFISPWPGC